MESEQQTLPPFIRWSQKHKGVQTAYVFTKQLKHMTEKVQILQIHSVLMKHSMISEGREKEAAQEFHTKWPYSSLKFPTNISDYLTSNQMKCCKNWRHFSSALKIAVRKGNVQMHIM